MKSTDDSQQSGETDGRLKSAQVSSCGTLREVLSALERGNLELALVMDENRLVGIMTDGDARRALLGGAELGSGFRDYIQTRFVAVSATTSRAEVIDLMRARRISQIPIVDKQGRLHGLHLLHDVIGGRPRKNRAVVMAGGKGQRLRPLTEKLPKPMIKVAGRPILERLILHLVGFGIRHVYLSVNYLAEMIEEYFEDGSRFGCRIEYLKEDHPLGTGGALSMLPERPIDPLLVMNGDLLTQADLDQMFCFHEEGAFRATVAISEYSHTVPFGAFDVADECVVRLKEKPTWVWSVNAGIYVINPDLIECIPANTEFQLTSLIEQCLSQRDRVGAFRISGEWIDVGRHAELRRAMGHLEQ